MGSNHSSRVKPSKSKTNYRTFVLGIIDVQNDFCKGGALAVAEAEEAIAAINRLRYICDNSMKIFISQDWHNEYHMSFAETHKKKAFTGPEELKVEMDDESIISVKQMMWPRHCVENTFGSQLHCDLIVTRNDLIIKKGTKTNVESYSAFGDAFYGKYEKTRLHYNLKESDVTDIILTGLATDYCVYNTALDAVRLGYKVHLILSCTRGVDKTTTSKALADLKEKEVIFYETVDDFHELNKTYIL